MTDENVNVVWRLDRPNARRSLIFCSTGAIAGLLIAGFGLFTAQGTRTEGVAAENVATVNGVPILMVDYVTHLRALHDVALSDATPAQKQQVLNDMVREELFVQRGVELDVQGDTTEVRQELVGAVEARIAVEAAAAEPSEEDLRAHYARNRAKFDGEGVMQVAEYVSPSIADKAAIAAALKAQGATPAVLARYGFRRSARMGDGEEYYFAARIHLGDALFTRAQAMKDGEVSELLVANNALHVLVMERNRPPVPPPFAEIRERVIADISDSHKKALIGESERFLRKRADIQIQKGFQ